MGDTHHRTTFLCSRLLSAENRPVFIAEIGRFSRIGGSSSPLLYTKKPYITICYRRYGRRGTDISRVYTEREGYRPGNALASRLE
jgi:hypothetical protein